MLTLEGSLSSRDAVGGTAPARVSEQLAAAQDQIVSARGALASPR